MFTLIVTRTPGCYLPADRKGKKLPWSLCLLTNLHVPANGYRDLLICCQWWHWHMSNSALGKRQNPQNGSPQFFYFRHPQVMSGLIPELWPGVRAEDNTAWNRSIPHWGNGQRSPWPWQQKNHWFCPDCIDAQCLIPNLLEVLELHLQEKELILWPTDVICSASVSSSLCSHWSLWVCVFRWYFHGKMKKKGCYALKQ